MVGTGIFHSTAEQAQDSANTYLANGTKASVKRSISKAKAGQPSYEVHIGK